MKLLCTVLILSTVCFAQINNKCWEGGQWEPKAEVMTTAEYNPHKYDNVCYHGATFADWNLAAESQEKAIKQCRKQKWKGRTSHYDAWFRQQESISCKTFKEVWSKP